MSPHSRQLVISTITLWTISFLVAGTVIAGDVLCRVTLHTSGTVAGPMVRLKDVADIWSLDSKLKQKLEHIAIVRSPLVGQSKWIMKEQVEDKLELYGLSPAQWELVSSGPTKVMLQTETLSAEKIRVAVEKHIRDHAPWPSEALTIRSIKFNRDIRVPSGKVALAVRTGRHSDWLGAVLFNVDVRINGRLVQKVSVPANIEVWRNVALAAKPLGKYQPVDHKGIKMVRMNLAQVPANAIIDPEEVIGKRAKRNIAINTVLRSDQIELPPLVKRGDRVQAIAVSPNFKVSVQALVKENGRKGEMIRILNLRSKKVIYAQVVDAQTVSVDF